VLRVRGDWGVVRIVYHLVGGEVREGSWTAVSECERVLEVEWALMCNQVRCR
jgi:hypothetical protein